MAVLRFWGTGLAALAALTISQVAAQCSGVTSRFTPKMGAGHTSSLLITGLKNPRGIVFDSAGNLLVAESTGGSIRRLVLKEQGDTVCVASNTVLIASGATNHGIDMSADGKTLYTSSLASVFAYPYDATAGTVGTGKAIITGMSNNGHPTRTILLSKVNPDIILVARGSNANIDTSTTSQTSGRSMIKQFSISAATQKSIDYTSGGEVTGWGLRNIVGIGEDPSGGIWSVENSMDDVKYNSKDVHNENPAEKLNYHGKINDTANKLKGANFGYPSCVSVWDPSVMGAAGMQVGQLFKADGTPAATDCASRQQGRIMFPSHTAPLDIKFTPDGSMAYVSFHGSWDRQPPDGYRVMKVKFSGGQPVEAVTSRTASLPVMENPSTASCPNSCFRPVGLAFDKKNRLFMSSDSTGEIYVISGA